MVNQHMSSEKEKQKEATINYRKKTGSIIIPSLSLQKP